MQNFQYFLFPEICHGWLQRVVSCRGHETYLGTGRLGNLDGLEFFVLEPVLILLHILCWNVGADHPLIVLYQHDGDQLVFGRGSVCVCNWYRTCHSTDQSNDRGQILPDQHFVVSVSTVGRNRMVGVWVRVICRPEDGMSGRILQTTPVASRQPRQREPIHAPAGGAVECSETGGGQSVVNRYPIRPPARRERRCQPACQLTPPLPAPQPARSRAWRRRTVRRGR